VRKRAHHINSERTDRNERVKLHLINHIYIVIVTLFMARYISRTGESGGNPMKTSARKQEKTECGWLLLLHDHHDGEQLI